MRTCGILIPAYNEEAHLGSVVRTALEASLGPVMVVDDGSKDATAAAAERAGAQVLRLTVNRGKGGAVCAGAQALGTDVVVLVDADLLHLRPEHLHALAQPVLRGEVDMTRGVFVGGRWRTATAQKLTPQLNGQRGILRTKLLSVPELSSSRYGIEVAITRYAKEQRWRCQDVVMPGVTQVMKEEKRGFIKGLAVRLRMYSEIVGTLVRNRLWR